MLYDNNMIILTISLVVYKIDLIYIKGLSMPSMKFVVLAKSVKHKKFCVAGKLFSNGVIGDWVRPINPATDTDALTHNNIEYFNKEHPEMFHITSFNYLRNVPHQIQRENYSIDPMIYWSKEGVFNVEHIERLVDNPPTLWINGSSSYNGENDRFQSDLVVQPLQSLYFIRVLNLKIRIKREGADFGNDLKKFRGFFTYKNVDYAFIITDPKIYSAYGQKNEGTYDVGACYITLSTAPHSDGYCYKFIAAVVV